MNAFGFRGFWWKNIFWRTVKAIKPLLVYNQRLIINYWYTSTKCLLNFVEVLESSQIHSQLYSSWQIVAFTVVP